MKNIIKNFSVVGACFVLLFCVYLLGAGSRVEKTSYAGSQDFPPISYFASSTSVTVAASDTLIVGTSTPRQYCRFTNTGGGATIYLALQNTTAATVGSGVPIFASSSFVISQEANNLYAGPVRGISSAGNASLAVACY